MMSTKVISFLRTRLSSETSGKPVSQCHDSANVHRRAMSYDENTYPEPEVFRPERYLNLTKTEMDAIDPRNFVFGFGRRCAEFCYSPEAALKLSFDRICPGRWLADDNVFLLTSRIISTMNISKAKNEKGEQITPGLEFTSGLTR